MTSHDIRLTDCGLDKIQNTFLDNTSQFPCSFNLGYANLDIRDNVFCTKFEAPHVTRNKWKEFSEILENEEDYFEERVWKENLRTRAYFEVGDLKKAKELNSKILGKLETYGERNLVALTNAAYLHILTGEVEEAYSKVELLKLLYNNELFWNLKIDAICEQAYEYFEFGGARHLLSSRKLFTWVLRHRPDDDNEKLQLLLAVAIRRCTPFKIYSEKPKEIDCHECALEAAKRLSKISRNESVSPNIKAAARVELAYLKYGDDVSFEKNRSPVLSSEEWIEILGSSKKTDPWKWKDLVEEALQIEGDKPSSKVLKMAGQLFRYSKTPADDERAENLLKQSIKIYPSNRAYHHLGLIERGRANEYERNNNPSYRRPINRYSPRNEPAWMNLPPPEMSKSKIASKSLHCITKAVHVMIKSYSEQNPYPMRAKDYFEQAVKLSNYQNTPVVYDLAMIYANTGNYKDCNFLCEKIIDEFNYSNTINFHLVNAYNLWGLCRFLEAEKASQTAEAESEKGKVLQNANALFGAAEYLYQDCEEKLMMAVKKASELAADVPELASCTTSLWGAFNKLEKHFRFNGNRASKDKLFRLCELVADYRPFLEVLDKDLFQGNIELDKKTLEQLLQCYLRENNFIGAELCLSFSELRPGGKGLLNWQNSEVLQQVLLLSAKHKQAEQIGHHKMDSSITPYIPEWKHVFDKVFKTDSRNEQVSSSPLSMFLTEKFDVVIVDDTIDENGQPEQMSVGCKMVTDIIDKILRLRVARVYDACLPGTPFLSGVGNIISNCKVAIFLLENKSCTSESQVCRSSENDSAQESETLAKESEHNLPAQEPQFSGYFKHFIEITKNSQLGTAKPEHIMSLVVGEHTSHMIPDVLQTDRIVQLSKAELEELSTLSQCSDTDKVVDLTMKLFKAIMKQNN